MTTPTFKSRFIYHLPDYWTPEQALAVLELLDGLREVIWAHYDLKVIDELRAQHLSDPGEPSGTSSGDDTF
jgi:putative IMPACT (imprinted ancient) family translation regulator